MGTERLFMTCNLLYEIAGDWHRNSYTQVSVRRKKRKCARNERQQVLQIISANQIRASSRGLILSSFQRSFAGMLSIKAQKAFDLSAPKLPGRNVSQPNYKALSIVGVRRESSAESRS